MDWKLKCEYLQQEITNLEQHIQDLKQLLQMNKEALIKQNLGSAIEFLQKEISILREQNESLALQRNKAMDKALIQEQIIQSLEFNERDLIEGLCQQIQELKLQVNSSHKHQEPVQALITQEYFVSDLRQQTMNLHLQIEKLNDMVRKQYITIQDLLDQKQDLVKLNYTLSNEILKYRNVPEDPNYINKLAVYQSKLLNDESYSEDQLQSPITSPLPTKVKVNKSVSMDRIPKLEISKAQKIQEYNLKKCDEKLQNVSSTEKVQQVIKELVVIRDKYHSVNLLKSQLEQYIEHQSRWIQELESSNHTLIKSYERYENKWKQIYSAFRYYKDHYNLYRMSGATEETINKKSRPDHSLLDEHL
ncbi:hypothetical protein pb186bvf_005948 [Paramecium bursaria]